MQWYLETIHEHPLIQLIGSANIVEQRITVSLYVEISDGSRKVTVKLRDKTIKLWREEPTEDFDIYYKFNWWVDKFKKSANTLIN